MKTFLAHDGPRKDANPSLEQMEVAITSSQDIIEGDATQGSEFLDDAIRMKEQAFERGDVNEGG
jgi:hypothetical protein